jgi:hypothetical protein
VVAAARDEMTYLSWESCSAAPNWSDCGSTCSIDVIHQEKWVARQTRLSAMSEYASAGPG